MKLFFKRAKEVQPVLGKLFKLACNDTSHPDVHDRALLYYRLIQANLGEAERIITASQATISKFTEDTPAELNDQLFEEFNTLSVIYGEPAIRWKVYTEPEHRSEDEEESYEDDESYEAEEEEDAQETVFL